MRPALAGPEIFDADLGGQSFDLEALDRFTSQELTERLKGEEIRISMDGRGRAYDHILIERLWRNFKYEEVCLKDYPSVNEAVAGLSNYFRFRNRGSPHQALGYQKPVQVRVGGSQ
ncbi:MAG: integrase core domain-containing protein [Thermodesulfobacteriota bacterium]